MKRWGAGLIIALALYAVIGFVALPQAVRYVLNTSLKEYVRVPARVEQVEFNPFTGELSVRDFHLSDQDRTLIAFSRLYLDLQIDSLWLRALHLQRIELDNADLILQRDKAGVLELVSLLALPPVADDQVESGPAAGLFPVRVDQVLLNNGKLRWHDLSQGKPVNLQVHPLTLTLHGVSTLPGEKTSLTLHAEAGKAGRLDVFADIAVADRRVSGTVRLEDGGLTRIWPYVQSQVPLVLGSGRLDVSVAFEVAVADTVAGRIHDGKLKLQSVTLKDKQDTSLLTLASLEASDVGVDLQKQRVQLGSVVMDGVTAPLVREADGRLHWQRVLAVPAAAAGPTAPPEAADRDGKPWQVDIAAITLQRAEVQLTDQSVTPATTVDLKALQVSVRDFGTTHAKPLRVALSSGIGAQGQLTGEGELDLAGLSGQMALTTRDIDLRVAQAWLNPFLRMELRSGLLDSQLQIRLGSVEPLAFSVGGDVRLHQVHAVDTLKDQDLLKWQHLQLSGLDYQHGKHLLIDKIDLQAPYSRFVINENRSTNFSELIIGETPAGAPDAVPPAAAPLEAAPIEALLPVKAESPQTPAARPLPIRIGSIDIRDGSAHFADYSLTPNFATAIAQLNGKIGTLDNQEVTPALLDINGKVDRYAPVSIAGRLTPFDPLQALDIEARFKRIELTTLTPYSGKFAGYRIRKGRLNLDLHYQISQGQLNATNKVVLEALQLGEKVESPDAVDLPVRLAVALLKDTDGNIKVELPVEGDLNNPKFNIGPVIWKTFRNLIVRAVKSPFSFIGGLIKGDNSENLGSIAFVPGSSELSKEAIGKLQTVAAALQQRPELRLEIEGASARSPDGEPMAQQLLEAEFRKAYLRQQQALGVKLPANVDSVQVPPTQKPVLLESMYARLVKKPMPADWAALPAPERTARQQTAILEYLGESERRLRQLARDRAAQIKGWLVDAGGLPDERIYLLNTQLREGESAAMVDTRLFLDSN